MKTKSISKVLEQFNAQVNLLIRLKRQWGIYKTEFKGIVGKGFVLPVALTIVFELLAKITKGKDVELLKWEKKCGLPKM